MFLPAFVFPLVAGAAGHLAPVWLRPEAAASHAGARRFMGRYGGIRAAFFLTSGVLPVSGVQCTGMPGLTALVWFIVLFVAWLWRD